jgi:hypothetical protein
LLAGYAMITAVVIKSSILRAMIQHSPLLAISFMLVSSLAYSTTLKMDAKYSSEMSVAFHWTTWHYRTLLSFFQNVTYMFGLPPKPLHPAVTLSLRKATLVCTGYEVEWTSELVSMQRQTEISFRTAAFLGFVHHPEFKNTKIHSVSVTGFVSVLR